MGIGGISIWQLLIIALIIVLLFGTKKLRSLGTDLGSALKGFKTAIREDDEDKEGDASDSQQQLNGEGETASGNTNGTDSDSTVSARTEDESDKKH